MAAKKKSKAEPIDGISPKDIDKFRKACRQVWAWSTPRKLCIKRATGEDGFPTCEQCFEKVPKVYVDHIVRVGHLDAGFFERLMVPSTGLQALCKKCHDKKTRTERRDLERVQIVN